MARIAQFQNQSPSADLKNSEFWEQVVPNYLINIRIIAACTKINRISVKFFKTK